MSHHTFAKGDRVAFSFDKSTIGTVTRSTKAETRVLWDSGHETPVDPAELVHTTQIQPPAGFRLIIDHGPWHGEYHGPEAHHGNVVVSSRWSCLGKPLIEFDVYSTVDGHSNFDREELEAIPGMIKSVLETIDLAHTEQYLAERPELLDNIKTVTDLERIADEHNLKVTGVFAVYEVRYKAELDAARISRQGGGDDA
ncbi:hypothetical protein [Glutamicibacter arilaitensis]|uniref:hypothetical protein n=1 Tax=Glutamicibacter arilaitensis TaxID=256701 RepID=UPI003F924370